MTKSTIEAREVELTPFEGLPVRQVGIEVPGVAGGLRDAIKIEPQEFHQGDEGYLTLRWKVGKVRFEPIDKEDPGGDQRRVHVFNVLSAAIVDGEQPAATALDEQQRRIEAAAGIARLDFEGEAKKLEHEAGEHQDLVEGCPGCDEEIEAERAEVEADYDAAAGE